MGNLLFVILDNLRRAHFCLIRISPKFPQSLALAQKVPALVQLNLQRIQASLIFWASIRAPIKSLLFFHEAVGSGLPEFIF